MSDHQKIREYLEGKKTYILSVFTASYTILKVFSIIDTTVTQDKAVYGLMLALLGMSLGAKIDRK